MMLPGSKGRAFYVDMKRHDPGTWKNIRKQRNRADFKCFLDCGSMQCNTLQQYTLIRNSITSKGNESYDRLS